MNTERERSPALACRPRTTFQVAEEYPHAGEHEQDRTGLGHRAASRSDHNIAGARQILALGIVCRCNRLSLKANATKGSVTIVVKAVVNAHSVLEEKIAVVAATEIEKELRRIG